MAEALHPQSSRMASVRSRTALVVLGGVIVFGAVLRTRGLTDGDMWRDDAWVAMSARVGIGTAWHMWVTSPGFYFLERTWILLHEGSTEWDQVPPLVLGVSCIPAMYATARYFAIGRSASLVAALVVCVSPTTILYSSRVKEYEADFLLACGLLVLAEAARRRTDRRRLGLLAGASVVSFMMSASIAPVIVGMWLALGLLVLASREDPRPFLVAAASAAAGCLLMAAMFFRHISPSNKVGELPFFTVNSSVRTTVDSTFALMRSLVSYMVGVNGQDEATRGPVFVVMAILLVVGVFHGRAMLAPILTLCVAVVATIAGATPLGTGRTDVVLYPAILLMTGAGLHRIGSLVLAHVGQLRVSGGLLLAVGSVLAVVLAFPLSGNTIGSFWTDFTGPIPYPVEDTQGLATAIHHAMHRGDHIVVDELMRYPWAFYEEHPLHVVFGRDWSTGFSIVSTNPSVFIAPSEYYEGGSNPAGWAKKLERYRRVWFVETAPLSLSPLYVAMTKDGWLPLGYVSATNAAAILLYRSGR